MNRKWMCVGCSTLILACSSSVLQGTNGQCAKNGLICQGSSTTTGCGELTVCPYCSLHGCNGQDFLTGSLTAPACLRYNRTAPFDCNLPAESLPSPYKWVPGGSCAGEAKGSCCAYDMVIGSTTLTEFGSYCNEGLICPLGCP